MAKTAAEMAGVKEQTYDFSFPDRNGLKTPKIQIRSYRITSNLLTAYDTGAINQQTDIASIQSLVKRSREKSSTLTLSIPDNLRFSSDFNWNAEERNVLSTYLANAINGDETKKLQAEGLDIGAAVLMRAAESLEAFGGDAVIRNMGLYSDALRELFFRGQDYRKFTWNWELVPRNAKEAESMMQCMRRMNLDAHPEKLSHGINILPGEFEVSFIDAKLPTIGKLVCTNIELDYGDAGGPVPRFTKDNYPAAMKLTMSFMELERQDRLMLERSPY